MARPTRVVAQPGGREVFLSWDSALDDAGHLRRCVACGCNTMFRTRSFPQVTLIVVVLAFAGAVLGLLGYATDPVVLSVLFVVLALDVGTLLFARKLLVCYRCRSTYGDVRIARYHRRWDRREAERHPPEPAPPAPTLPQSGEGAAGRGATGEGMPGGSISGSGIIRKEPA